VVDPIGGCAVTWSQRKAIDRSAARGTVLRCRRQREGPCKAGRQGTIARDHPLDRDGLAESCRARDELLSITTPIPKMMHLWLPATLFSRLSDDFDLPNAPVHSARYLSGIRDGILNSIGLSILSQMSSETSVGRM
jgi:hypothetical protein